jgi:hypothetical protein
LLGAGPIPQFVDAYIQFWEIVKAGYAAGISPRATTLDGGHAQFVRFVCVAPAAAPPEAAMT